MNIAFAGWKRNGAWDQRRINTAFKKFIGLCPNMDMEDFNCWSDRSGKFVLANLSTPAHENGPRKYFFAKNSSAATYAGLPVILTSEGPAKFILKAEDILDYAQLEKHGEGPFVCFYIEDNGLHVLTDPFGMKHVFQVTSKNVSAWSTSLNLLHDILDLKNYELNSQAVAEYVAKDFVGSGLSLVNRVDRLLGGKHVHVRSDGYINVKQYYNFPASCANRHREAIDYKTLADQLMRLGDGLAQTGLPCKAGITGGHDSRLIVAALCKSRKLTLNLFTSGTPGHPDYDIGKTVASYFGLPWEPRHVHVDTQIIESMKDWDWQSAFAKVVRATDGHFSLFDVDSISIKYYKPKQIIPVVIIGHGGGTPRSGRYYNASTYWSKRDYLRYCFGDNLIDIFTKRIASVNNLLTSEGKALARKGTFERLKYYKNVGVRDYGILPLYYAEDKMVDWAGGSMRAFEMWCDPFNPLMIRSFQETAVNLKPLQQLKEELHYRLMRTIDPEILKIPFDEPFPPQQVYLVREFFNILLDRINKRFISKSTRNYRDYSDNRMDLLEIYRKQWFKPLLETNDLSSIWSVVDYNRIEEIINDDSKIKDRRNHMGHLYGLLTCWALLRYRNQPIHYEILP